MLLVIVLGIDAAWTANAPSGVAMVAGGQGEWRCVAIAPSYDAFIALADGRTVNWAASRFKGSIPDVSELLDAATVLSGGLRPDVVAVDMPLSRDPIVGRRRADNEVSTAFGSRWCSAHSPNAERPGPIGATLTSGCAHLGYPLAAAHEFPGAFPRLIEVYPHPAILTLLCLERRFEYKVGKARRYWPDLAPAARRSNILGNFHKLLEGLQAAITGIDLPLPGCREISSMSHLKRFEDSLDALVCAWVGTCYADRTAYALGDDRAAIWFPELS
ncbi:MAG TPA: DUF429 domain-containing protein [Oscillatoriaceae cyanobacterium]